MDNLLLSTLLVAIIYLAKVFTKKFKSKGTRLNQATDVLFTYVTP